jgi:DNA-directed RNA polymerase subunit RPC12/RpoP|nr:MAG TPA: hydrogenase/urease nickel incorporation protein [Caudoviricetes sp.]
MADLIDREELLNNRPEYLNPQMEDEIKSARHQGWNDCNSYYYDLIIKQPTVETVKHAHWIVVGGDLEIFADCKCSACGYIYTFNEYNIYNYCPYCGAKMDEVMKE